MPIWFASNLVTLHSVSKGSSCCINECILYLDAASYSNAYFGQSGGPVHITNVDCSGNETSLLNCIHSSTVTCSHSDDAGVLCRGDPCFVNS